MAKLSVAQVEQLISGLEEVISKVKENDHEKYDMMHFTTCVLGVNFGGTIFTVYSKVKSMFGYNPDSFGSRNYKIGLTKLQADVQNLFTVNVANKGRNFTGHKTVISKENWLLKADKVLKKLNRKLKERKETL